jgi:hypothetical protein
LAAVNELMAIERWPERELPAPAKIDQVDRLGAEHRLERADDEEHHHPLPGDGLQQRPEIGKRDELEHAERPQHGQAVQGVGDS